MDTNRCCSKAKEPNVSAWLRQFKELLTRWPRRTNPGAACWQRHAPPWLAQVLPRKTIPSDLGIFAAYHRETGVILHHCLSPHQVVTWDTARQGPVEFVPAGDRWEMGLLFGAPNHPPVTGQDLRALDALLQDLGGDSTENYLKVYFAVRVQHGEILTLSREAIEQRGIRVFLGTHRADLLRTAAVKLFEQCYPEHYAIWCRTRQALEFDRRAFFRSPCFQYQFVNARTRLALVVAACCLRPACLQNRYRQTCQPTDPTSFFRLPGKRGATSRWRPGRAKSRRAL